MRGAGDQIVCSDAVPCPSLEDVGDALNVLKLCGVHADIETGSRSVAMSYSCPSVYRLGSLKASRSR